jgi:hypothetical protein
MNERRNEGITKLQEKAFYSDGLRKLVDRWIEYVIKQDDEVEK